MCKYIHTSIILAFILLFGTISLVSATENDVPPRPSGLLLTWQQDPTTTMTIDWHTGADGEPSTLEYRLNESDDEWQAVRGETIPFPHSSRLIHRIELTGLEPDTEYSFRFSEFSPPRKFRTMPETADRPIRFASGGDVRHQVEWMDQTNRRAMAYEPDFVLWGGDLAYADGREDRAYRWYEFMESVMNSLITADGRVVPVLASIGNHEVLGGYYWREERRDENMPQYQQTDEIRELFAPYYYNLLAFPGQPGYGVLDFGNYMTVIVLDTEHTNPIEGKQAEWLESVLKERQGRPNIIPVYHAPGFPSVRRPNVEKIANIRKTWVPLFEKYGVEIVFENHDHAYKRTYPIRDNKIDPTGIVYIGDGAWGVRTREIGYWQSEEHDTWYLKHADSQRHFIIGTIHGSLQHYLIINEDGHVIDEYPQTPHLRIDRSHFLNSPDNQE